MTNQHLVAAIVATLLMGTPGSAQSASDLLQKGIHAQETVGDVDGAIQIFRQVVNSSGGNKALAAQAQYQLVVCMVQKGDRPGARKELELLARNFADQPDMVSKARKLVPGADTILAPPWGMLEGSQLNLKRDGVPTGETLYYSVDPDRDEPGRTATPGAMILSWELTTPKTRRYMRLLVDRDGVNPLQKKGLTDDYWMYSNDAVGDPVAAGISGPAIDQEQSVFQLRRMPLAVGFKTAVATTPFTLGSTIKSPVEAVVTGIEAVQVPAGKFNCYKVSMAAIGQTFWIGMERSRPLVKFQAGKVEAELVRVWTEPVLETLTSFAKVEGWHISFPHEGPGLTSGANFAMSGLVLTARKFYTPKAEIQQALQQDVTDWARAGNIVIRPDSVEKITLDGHDALRCFGERPEDPKTVHYAVWVRSENLSVEFEARMRPEDLPVFRWKVERALVNVKIP